MSKHIVHSLAKLLLLLWVSWGVCNALQQDFVQCISKYSGAYNTTQHLYTPDSPLYLSLLNSTEQNPRWFNYTSLRPVIIFTPYNETEIQAAILCSRMHGLQIRVKSGGHDYEGLSYLCKNPFIIVDLINFRSIVIDLEEETAWVQSGATIGEVYYIIAQNSGIHGFPAGLCPSVGVGGHFSGGGFGTMLRKYGLAADNVIDAILIDVNGRILNRESMCEDLFWAIRGGGGASFGIIVSWKIQLVQVPPIVTVFTIDKKLDQGTTKLVHKWQYVAHKLHQDLFIRVIIQVVDRENIGRNKTIQASFNSLFLGKVNELIPLTNMSFPELGLSAKDCTEMSWIESAVYFAGYPIGQSLDVLLDRTTRYKTNFKAKSDFIVKPMPEEALEGIWERFLEEELVFLIMDPYGGRMNEISEYEIPFPYRKGNLYNMQYIVKWEVNEVRESSRHLDWINRLYRFMKPYASHSPRAAYLNYRDLDLGINKQDNTSYWKAKTWGRKYFKNNFRRLAKVKRKVDPTNFFRNEQSIPPIPTYRKSLYS